LSTTGKIFIEKPLDASIEKAKKIAGKIGKADTIYGFDHYLAELHPFLRRVHSYLRKIDGPESLEINILENNVIPFEKVYTLKEGTIFDLFPHVLAVSAAVVERKLAPTKDILQNAEFIDGARAKYIGWPFFSETCARIEFRVGNRSVTGRVGKGIGATPDKQMVIYDADKKIVVYIKFQLDNCPVRGNKVNLESKHVESFLETILKGKNVDLAPGVLSFGAAFAILEWLSRSRDKIIMGSDYNIGTNACQ
jgi:hypothetical protein